jgi:glycosyltransferase involved in cell wall biosynthesis
MKKVLFVADGSLSNPILQSQGIPQLLINSEVVCKPFLISFENPLLLSKDEVVQKRYTQSKEMLCNKVVHIEIIVPFAKSEFILQYAFLRILRFLLMMFKGVIIVSKLANKERIDVVHCRSSYPTIIGIISRFFTKFKVIYDNRGIPGEETKVTGFNPQSFVYRKIEYSLLRLVDTIVVVSKPFKTYLVENYSIKNLSEKIEVIENGFSPDRINFSERLRKSRRIEEKIDDKIVMVYSGSLSKWQMFEKICDAFILLHSIESKAFFLILSPDEDRVKEILSTKMINSENYRVYNITNNQLGEYLILGDFGTLFREKLLLNKVAAPIKFAEYLAAGLPVLLTEEIGDTEAFCNEGRYGVVIENLNKDLLPSLIKMLELISEKEIHGECAELAQRELSVVSAATKYARIYFS